MARRVNNPPLLPTGAVPPELVALSRFDQDLIQNLIREFSDHAYRLNLSIPNDGTELPGFFREKLTAPRTLFVSTTGSDTTGDGSSTNPYATIQFAIDKMADLDISTQSAAIQVFDGTYNITTTGSQPAAALRNFVGKGPIGLIGNIASPQNVVLNVTGGDVFGASSVLGQWNIAGFTAKALTSGFGILRASGGSTFLNLQAVRYDSASFHVLSDYGSQVFLIGSQEIIGDASFHYGFTNKGIIQDAGKTVVLTGSRTFSFFAFGQNNGLLNVQGTTYTGPAATGQKFFNDSLAIIQTGGQGVNLFPGSVAGTSWPGGYF